MIASRLRQCRGAPWKHDEDEFLSLHAAVKDRQDRSSDNKQELLNWSINPPTPSILPSPLRKRTAAPCSCAMAMAGLSIFTALSD